MSFSNTKSFHFYSSLPLDATMLNQIRRLNIKKVLDYQISDLISRCLAQNQEFKAFYKFPKKSLTKWKTFLRNNLKSLRFKRDSFFHKIDELDPYERKLLFSILSICKHLTSLDIPHPSDFQTLKKVMLLKSLRKLRLCLPQDNLMQCQKARQCLTSLKELKLELTKELKRPRQGQSNQSIFIVDFLKRFLIFEDLQSLNMDLTELSALNYPSIIEAIFCCVDRLNLKKFNIRAILSQDFKMNLKKFENLLAQVDFISFLPNNSHNKGGLQFFPLLIESRKILCF